MHASDVSVCTPVEAHGDYLVKRDDLFTVAGAPGGKARTCWAIATAEEWRGDVRGLVTAGARSSPQVHIVARIAHELGVPCRVHTPKGKAGPQVRAAVQLGAERVEHLPGYNTVIVARARDDAAARGWVHVPFGMECQEAVDQTAGQVANLPFGQFSRIVVPVGSGMSLAGILTGLQRLAPRAFKTMPVLGVVVGADPSKRLHKFAPPGPLQDQFSLVNAGLPYDREAPQLRLGHLALDPIYEAKCLPFLRAGDLLWVVGMRPSVPTVDRKRPYRWMQPATT